MVELFGFRFRYMIHPFDRTPMAAAAEIKESN